MVVRPWDRIDIDTVDIAGGSVWFQFADFVTRRGVDPCRMGWIELLMNRLDFFENRMRDAAPKWFICNEIAKKRRMFADFQRIGFLKAFFGVLCRMKFPTLNAENRCRSRA